MTTVKELRRKKCTAQSDSQRLARVESKLTKLMQFVGMPTDGRKPIVDKPLTEGEKPQ